MAPSEEAVRAHMNAILASPAFAQADRMSRFLRYAVEMKLRGEEGQIKEFVLGREVFDRGDDYDPRLDPIVRVEARRLRQRLSEYYEGVGKAEAMRIEFPKGGYAPVIHSAAAEPAVKPSRRGATLAVAGGLAVAMGAGAFWLSRSVAVAVPMTVVVPARWVWANTAQLEATDERLAEAVTAELATRGRVAVVGWPIVAGLGGGKRREIQELGRITGAQTIVVVSVRRESNGGGVTVTAFGLDAATGRKQMVGSYDETGQLSQRIAADIEQSAAKVRTSDR